MMHAIAHRGCMDTVRESALKIDSGRKIPYCSWDLNPSQYCAWLFSWTFYQLSYSLPQQHTCKATHIPRTDLTERKTPPAPPPTSPNSKLWQEEWRLESINLPFLFYKGFPWNIFCGHGNLAATCHHTTGGFAQRVLNTACSDNLTMPKRNRQEKDEDDKKVFKKEVKAPPPPPKKTKTTQATDISVDTHSHKHH